LIYVGLLQVERGLLDILALLWDHPDWRLDLAGFGGDEDQILPITEELPNVHWHGRVGYLEALSLSSTADVMLALYDPALPNHRYASPNKLFEAMMLSKPVVVAGRTNIDGIVSREECGLVVEYGDRDDIEQALLTLEKNTTLRRKLGQNARRAYERQYNWSVMVDHLNQFYAQLE
jgi:glycosyltransferase involved in cell wall biosynthesis